MKYLFKQYMKLNWLEKVCFTPAFLFIFIGIGYLLIHSVDFLLMVLLSPSFKAVTLGKGYITNINTDINWFFWLKIYIIVSVFEIVGLVTLRKNK